MSGNKIGIIWSPVQHDKFVVWGQEITLYEIARLKDIEKKVSFTQLSSTRGASPVASQSGSGVRCVDISAIAEQPDPILALGYANGRVSLTSLKQAYDPLGLAGREFEARYSRPCNSLSWNHQESNLLAVGMDKHRADNCIMLWDVQSCLSNEFNGDGSSPPSGWPEVGRAMCEAGGVGETAHCVTWCSFATRTILAGINHKHIKIFDLRESGGKASGTALTRQCLGVCAEQSGWQIASRGDSAVCVWDARALASPVLTLPQPRAPREIHWCPTRRNLLICLQRDSSTLRLYDIQQANDFKSQQSFDSATSASSALEEAECGATARGRSVVERELTPAPAALVAFACHPEHRARLLALTATGGMVEFTVSERVTVSCGASGALAWAGGGALRALPPGALDHVADLATVARRRATLDYGLKTDLWQNAEVAGDEALSGLWHFLALSKSLVEDGCVRNSPCPHPGVRTVLRPWGDNNGAALAATGTGTGASTTQGAGGAGGYRSEAVPTLLPDTPNRKIIIYRSGERSRALSLCGWGWGWENAGAGVECAEAEGTPCRAAALAAFHLRARTALEVLARARDARVRVAALALLPSVVGPGGAGAGAGTGGGAEERLWREALAAAAGALPDPYLRAMLHFLAASHQHPPDFSLVLKETEMRLEDRVAFACIYLSDSKLHEYVQSACEQLSAQGDLAGILLTGVTPEGLRLVRRWVERTGDVQTAALLAARCCTPDLMRDPLVVDWLDNYRSLLDSWQMWWARCALDTWVCAGAGAGAAEGGAGGAGRRVGVACTYCGKSVAAPVSARPRPAFARLPPPAAKMKQVSSCPNCRKPLPRCGVCLLHLGTSAGGAASGAASGAGGGAHFDTWFSWCVACRHGGHAAHMLQWFSEHSECPVSSCSCRCSALDPPDRPGRLDRPDRLDRLDQPNQPDADGVHADAVAS